MPTSVKISAAQLLRHRWSFYVRRPFNWMVESTQMAVNSETVLKKYVGVDSSQRDYLILNGDEYGDEAEMARINRRLDNAFNRGQDFLAHLAKKVLALASQVKAYDAELQQTDFSQAGDASLAKQIERFQEYYLRSFVPGWSRPDNFLEQKTKALLQKDYHCTAEITDAWFKKIATYPNLGELAYNDEPLNLLRLAKKIHEEKASLSALSDNLARQLEAHVTEYRWMKGPLLVEAIEFTPGDYRDRLRTLLGKNISAEIARILAVRAENERVYRQAVKELAPSQSLQQLMTATRQFIFLRTFTTEISDHLFFTARQTIWRECARRLNMSAAEIVNLTPGEIAAALRGQPVNLTPLLAERQTGFAIIWLEGKVSTLFGRESVALQRTIYQKIATSRESAGAVIKGQAGAPGKVRGRAKILLGYHDIGKLQPGDILVASMTTPDYVAAMEKAAAFVTDEGGITCHAAIVAREFGVPCVIGTQVATQKLKDGDLIEVDADRGVVRLLK